MAVEFGDQGMGDQDEISPRGTGKVETTVDYSELRRVVKGRKRRHWIRLSTKLNEE